MNDRLSMRVRAARDSLSGLTGFMEKFALAGRVDSPGISDFTFGNPHEMPQPAFVEALRDWSVPRDPQWFAYKMNEASSREVVASSLRKWRDEPFEAQDIFLTNGATAAISVVLGLIVDPGDEVVFISPPWFQYEAMILIAGGSPVRVSMDRETFDLDIGAIRSAISARTRAIIINSPHNPTGKIYQPETLKALSDVLSAAGRENGRTVYMLSDEAYSRIVFDNRRYYSPTSFYPHSFLVYTYSKALLTPGQRIGYIALPPGMPGREDVRPAVEAMQMLLGWSFPNALLQHALGDIERIQIDMGRLQRRRDLLTSALRDMGYKVCPTEGTFYMIVKTPIEDDRRFVELLNEYDIYCIPGSLVDLPGHIRICLTAGDEMIDRSLPGFSGAIKRAVHPQFR